MRMVYKRALVSGLFTLVVVGASVTGAHDPKHHKKDKPDESQAGHSHEMSEIHGGRVTMTPNHHFEVLFTDDEARVYCYDKVQEPLEAGEDASATLLLKTRDGKDVSLTMSYVQPDPAKGRALGYFAAAHDFSDVADNTMKAVVELTGLTNEPIEFKTSVVVAEAAKYACPMNCVAPASDPMSCSKCGMQMVRASGEKDDKGHDHSGHGHSHDGRH